MTPDVNVLVAALRPDHPHHPVASDWLESAVLAAASGSSFTLMPMVIASYLRLVTSSKIFAKPTSMKDAVAAVDKLLSAPGVVLATLGAEWAELQKLCVAKNLSGNDVPDACSQPPHRKSASTWSPLTKTSKGCCRETM